jgi:hypothetical protein
MREANGVRRMFRNGTRAALLGCAALALAAPGANAAMGWNTASFNFGSHSVGSPSPPQTFTLTASCDNGAPICTTPMAGVHNFGPPTATGPGFAIVAATNTCAAGSLTTLFFPSEASCTTQVTFTPTAAGAATGSLNTPTGPDIALSGTGLGGATNPTTPATPPGKKCKKKKGKKGAAAAKKCKKKK